MLQTNNKVFLLINSSTGMKSETQIVIKLVLPFVPEAKQRLARISSIPL